MEKEEPPKLLYIECKEMHKSVFCKGMFIFQIGGEKYLTVLLPSSYHHFLFV